MIKLGSKIEFSMSIPLFTKSQGGRIDPNDPMYIANDGVLYWHLSDLEGNWCAQKLELTTEEKKIP